MGDSWQAENLQNQAAGSAWASAPRDTAHTAWVILDMGEATNPYWELRIHPSQLYPEAFASTVQVSASNNAVTWEPLTSAHGLVMGDGSEPLTLRFPSNQSRYLKVDFENTTAQPGDRYYTVVDHLAVGGAPNLKMRLNSILVRRATTHNLVLQLSIPFITRLKPLKHRISIP